MAKQSSSGRIPTDGQGQGALHNPFAALELTGLPVAEKAVGKKPDREESKTPAKGIRLDIRRETAGRHGKAVITITPAEPMMEAELKELAQRLRQRLSSGGTLKQGVIEIQGDRLPEVRQFLEQAGFRCRQTGG